MTRREELLALIENLDPEERAEILAALTKPPPPPPPVQVPKLTCPHCGDVPTVNSTGFIQGIRHIDFLAEYRAIWTDGTRFEREGAVDTTEMLDTTPRLECERCRKTFAYPAGVTVGWE